MAESAEERNLREFREIHSQTNNREAWSWGHNADVLLARPIKAFEVGEGRTTTPAIELGYLPANFALVRELILRLEGKVDGLVNVVSALSTNPNINAEEVTRILEEAAGKAFGTLQVVRFEDVPEAEGKPGE